MAVVDIETSNVYIYGQDNDNGYNERIYLLYDGLSSPLFLTVSLSLSLLNIEQESITIS
jgi:hypothetical protein